MVAQYRYGRFVLVLGMIPLALLSGLPATGCICADGKFKPFGCAGALGRLDLKNSEPRSTVDGTCPHCQGLPSAEGCGKNRACCRNDDGACVPRGRCCQLVKQTLATISADVVTPTSDEFLAALLPPTLGLSLVVFPTVSKHVEQIDTGPPVDRVIVLRCLLI